MIITLNTRRLLAALITFGAMTISSIGRAEIIVQAESKSVPSASLPVSSFFDVFFAVTPGDTSNPLAGFQIKLDINPNNGGITFGTPESVFSAPARLAALPSNAMFDATGSDADTILASAFVNTGAEQKINDGTGIIRVPFTVAPGTIGTFNVTIDQQNTLLSDASGGPISYQPVNGTIVVAVPEPGTILLILTASVFLVFVKLRKRER